MTQVDGPAAGTVHETAPDTSASPAGGADVPVRAPGLQLIGEMKGSGYREPPALARRGDGQTIQLTGLLYLVLEHVDGHSDFTAIAERVSASYGKVVTADNVRSLVEGQLRESGLVLGEDGTAPNMRRSNPLLALRFKYAVTDPERTRQLTAPFALLFNPAVVLVMLVALGLVSWWVFFEKGLASATYQAFDKPALLLLVVIVTILSAGFHEFGHAAAARRGGATPGAMGAGVYLVWPAFYTDVTDSYRLGRWGRVVTDLGGLYFNAIVAVAIGAIWWVSGYDALLLVVATQILQMVRQLTPLVRFDGYHVLADVTGVPDLFQRIRPTLLGLLPWRWKDPESRLLKPWARAVVSVWVLVVVPMLLFSLWCMVIALPRILGTAWSSAGKQSQLLQVAWSDGDVLQVLARGIAVLAVVFPVLATAVVLVRLVRSLAMRVWSSTRGRPARRGLAGLLTVAVLAGLGYLWWPREGTYAPVLPFEGGTLTQAASRATTAVAQTTGLARPAPGSLRVGDRGHLVTGWANKDARPTAAHPQLALVLVPRDGNGAAGGRGGQHPWVFPFNHPLSPGPGDNQALAVNTKDNTAQYDVAFALVWVDDSSPALNSNEAYAFASCKNCAAVSVAFQVVLVTGHNHVAVPQNLSGALNYNCVGCLTYALATQLFVTLDGPLSADATKQLDALWQQIATYGAHITEVPLSQIQAQLTAYEQQILQIVGVSTATAQPTPTPTPGADAGNGSSPQPTPSAAPTQGPTDSGTSDGTSTGTGSGTSSSTSGDTGTGTSSGSSSSTDGSTGTSTQPTDAPNPSPAPSSGTNP